MSYRNFSLAFIFFRNFEAITFPLKLVLVTKVLYYFVLLNGMAAKEPAFDNDWEDHSHIIEKGAVEG